jgi:hypothetical protein
MKRVPVLLMLVTLLAAATARGNGEVESVFSDYLNVREPAGFLRVPGLTFTSSMGMCYVASSGGYSGGIGYYLGHFNLSLSRSLTLNADVGVSSMVSGPSADETPQLFIPNVDLTYRPSDAFMMRLQFSQYRRPMGLDWRRNR